VFKYIKNDQQQQQNKILQLKRLFIKANGFLKYLWVNMEEILFFSFSVKTYPKQLLHFILKYNSRSTRIVWGFFSF